VLCSRWSNDRATFRLDRDADRRLRDARPAPGPRGREDADGRRRRGRRTRESILHTAADIASVEGLEGLSIGRLAAELDMSKSGLFAHFGSKEELQLATTDAARRRFVQRVGRAGVFGATCRGRLETLMTACWTTSAAASSPAAASSNTVRAEFDSRPDSPVRDVVAGDQRQFIALIEREVRKAQEAGDLDPDVDASSSRSSSTRSGRRPTSTSSSCATRRCSDRAAAAITARLSRRRLTAAAAGLTDLFGATYDRCRGAPPGALLRGRGRRAALRPRGRPAST
jgi:AcrR family transcriptional regulator